MYSIVVSVWYWYCAIRWKCSSFLAHSRASVKGILWLAKGFKIVTPKTGTITCPSASISLSLHCVTWLYGLLNRAKLGYGDFISQSPLNLSYLQWCSRTDPNQSIKCISRPRYSVWTMPGTISVVGEMQYIFQKTPSEVANAQSSRYYLASRLSFSSLWVVSINFWKHSQ